MGIMRTIFISAIVLWYGSLAYSQPLTVIVDGVGFVVDGNTASARDRAIADAQVRAVEQAFGVNVDARAALHKSLLIADTVITRSQGMIRDFKIIHEQIEPGGLYRVKLQAAVDPEIIAAQFAAAAGAKRVLLTYPSDPPAVDRAPPPLIDELAGTFSRAGFQLNHLAMHPSDFMILDEFTIKQLAIETNSDILVAGSVRVTEPHCPVSNFCASFASGRVRLYDGKNGDLIATSETGKEPPRGFGHDTAAARSAALDKGIELLVQNLMDVLFSPPEHLLTVSVINIPDLDGYRKLKNQLAILRWVKQVTADSVGYHPVKSVFQVRFAQRPELFAGMLDKLGDYRLIGNSRRVFTLTAR